MSTNSRVGGYRGKRALDLTITIPALILLSPVIAVVAALVATRMGRPVLFTQVRPGLGEAPFPVYKFRTMKEAYDAQGVPLPDRDRLTALGRFLRASSLDELPGLLMELRNEERPDGLGGLLGPGDVRRVDRRDARILQQAGQRRGLGDPGPAECLIGPVGVADEVHAHSREDRAGD